jgi:type IV secretory pathway TrbL component
MRQILLRALAVVSGALLLLGIARVGPAQAANYVGGLNLDEACGSEGNKSTATQVGTTAYHWRCVTGGVAAGIDRTCACQNQYGVLAIDRFRNFYDRNSWECYV